MFDSLVLFVSGWLTKEGFLEYLLNFLLPENNLFICRKSSTHLLTFTLCSTVPSNFHGFSSQDFICLENELKRSRLDMQMSCAAGNTIEEAEEMHVLRW